MVKIRKKKGYNLILEIFKENLHYRVALYLLIHFLFTHHINIIAIKVILEE